MRETKSKTFLMKRMIFAFMWISVLFAPAAVGSAASGNTLPGYLEAESLQRQGSFKASDSSVTLRMDDKAGGVMISGDAADLQNTVFSYGDIYDFDSIQAEYFLVDALAQRKKQIKLAFYLDDAAKPFATVDLARQRKAEIWSTVKNRCVKLSGDKISGSHKLHFKVITGEVGSLQLVVRSLSFFKSDIPMVEFDLDESQGSIAEMNGDSSHDTECYGKVSLDIPEGYKSEYTENKCYSATYELDYIRGRGNSTWWAQKKPYKFKLAGKQDLLGMGANKHWILLANYYDVTMLRNKLTYWLGAQLGMEFTPQCEFVNVVMNGEYLGSYYLCEQVRVGKSRVDIDDLDKDESTRAATDEATISGGYLLGMEPYGEELRQSFSTSRENRFLIESPSFEGYINEAQFNYIQNYMQQTEDAIYGLNFEDASGKSYQEYMDIDAAVDYYWIQEISMNGDAFVSPSTYLYKKRNGKLYWGPLWDFDYVAWGATEYYGNSCEGFSRNTSTWFGRLFDDPVFCKKVTDRWPAIKEKLLEACADGGQIDLYSRKQYESQRVNYEIWKKYSDTQGEGMLMEDGDGMLSRVAVTYDSEVERFKLWVKQRVEWIDANLDKLQKTYCTVKFMADDKEIVSMQIEQNNSIRAMPDAPVKEGYVFTGWWYTVAQQDGKEMEYQVDEGTTISQNMVVYAKWRERSEIKPVRQIGFDRDEYYTFWDDRLVLTYCVLPFDADGTGITWSSSDEKIATVDGGIVSAVARSGDVVITATSPIGVIGRCLVHIMDYRDYDYVELQSISFEEKEITVSKGGYARLSALLNPKNATIWFNLGYASSDEEIFKINGCGYIYGVKEGTAVAVVYGRGDVLPAFCKVTVVDDGKEGSMPDVLPLPTLDVTAAPSPTVTPEPGATAAPSPDVTPEPGVTPGITPEPSPSVSPLPIKIEKTQPVASATPNHGDSKVKKGTKFDAGGLCYQVLTVGNKRTVTCTGLKKNGAAKLIIPASVDYQGKAYKVVKISKRAFYANKKLKKVTVGKNITEIGSKAFAECKNLKEIIVKSVKLVRSGKGAVAGTSPKLKLKAPKGKSAKYHKLFGI